MKGLELQLLPSGSKSSLFEETSFLYWYQSVQKSVRATFLFEMSLDCGKVEVFKGFLGPAWSFRL